MTVKFDTTPEDAALIDKIVARTLTMGIIKWREPNVKRDLNMDLTAVHVNGCQLKLKDLLNAPDFDFAHDVTGIVHHIDRTAGKLKNCFLPRFAAKQGP